MLEKTKRLQELYHNFHPDGKVIQGGIVNESQFEQSKGKVMSLLKEVNDENCKYNWTLPGLLQGIQAKETTFYRMWKNISRWALATEYPDISFQEIESKNMLYEGLSLVSTTNLKKVAGGGTSDYDDIEREAEKNKDEWFEEINIIQPYLIICGGTYWIVKKVLNIPEDNCFICGSGAEYFVLQNKIYLDFVHPAYPISDKLMFAFFKETYNCLRKEFFIPKGIGK